MSSTLVFGSKDYISDFKIRDESIETYRLTKIAISYFTPSRCILKLFNPKTKENKFLRIFTNKTDYDISLGARMMREEEWLQMRVTESNLYKFMIPLYPMEVVLAHGEVWNDGGYPDEWYFIFSDTGKGITLQSQFYMDLYYYDPDNPEGIWKFKEHQFTILDEDHEIGFSILPFRENDLYLLYSSGKSNYYMGNDLIERVSKYDKQFIVEYDGNVYIGLTPVYDPESPMELPKTEDSFYELVKKNPLLQSGSVAKVAYDPDSLAKDDRYKVIYVIIKKNPSLSV